MVNIQKKLSLNKMSVGKTQQTNTLAMVDVETYSSYK